MTAADAAHDAPRLPHVPALDGLRGLAVAGVIAFHAGFLGGGFLGVDLFFVLSGFLITSLLLAEYAGRGRIGLRRFWARRARRLLPALLVVLAAVAGYAWFVASPAELGRVRGDALATLGYVANWRDVVARRSYWDLFAVPSPLEHAWSLAIEEQFYLLWPLLVAGVLRLAGGSRRVLLGVTALLAAASAAAMAVLHRPFGDPSRVYFGTDTRAAGILVGAVLAIALAGRAGLPRPRHMRRRSSGLVDVIAALALVGVLATWALARGTSGWLYEGGLLALEAGVALVIWAVARPEAGWLARVLSWSPLRGLGLISYGLYLWHWPVFVVLSPARTGLADPALLLVRLGASVGLAVASFRLVEQPVRRGALRGWRVRALTPAAFGAVAVVVVVATVGSVSRHLPVASADPGGGPLSSVAASAPAPRAGASVLVAGDSGAFFLGAAMERVGPDLGADVMNLGHVACGIARQGDGMTREDDGAFFPDPEGCDDWPERWRSNLAQARPDVALLVLGWPGLGIRVVDGQPQRACQPAFDAYYRREVDAAIETLTSTGAGVAVATVPYLSDSPADSEARRRVDCLNRIYEAAVAAHPDASVVDLFNWTCPGRTCREDVDGIVLRPDRIHFEGAGADIAARWVLQELVKVAGGALRVVVAGDSTAWVLAAHFKPAAHPELLVTASAWVGCGLTPGRPISDGAGVWWTCDETAADYERVVERDRPDIVVLMAGMWEVLDHEIDGRVLTLGDPGWTDAVRAGIEDYVRVAQARGARVALLTAPCYHLEEADWLPIGPRNDPERIAAYNAILVDVAAAHPRSVQVVELGSHVCPDGPPSPQLKDGIHLSAVAAVAAWEWLAPQLEGLAS
ncbi:MAG: acyltransferase family protein [Acidimicrobiales bacterium]